jgi:Bacterial membrane protein N terminal
MGTARDRRIVDVVVTMNWVDFGDGRPVRGFVCTSPNPWGYPAKDRSGKRDQGEPPDLGALIKKVLPPRASHVAVADPGDR